MERLLSPSTSAYSGLRLWHDVTGKFRVNAEFKGYNRFGQALLHKTNGITIAVPLQKLSLADRDYLELLQHVPVVLITPSLKTSYPAPLLQPALLTLEAVPDGPRRYLDSSFFLEAGCALEDAIKYAAAFEDNQIHIAVLPQLSLDSLNRLNFSPADASKTMEAFLMWMSGLH